MTAREPIRAILLDPSLFTAPYDAALTEGLLAAGIEPMWAVRPTRRGDTQPIALRYIDALFYRHVDEMTWLPDNIRKLAKAVAHAWGLARLAIRVHLRKPHVVHFQWTVIPALDALAMALIRKKCPVVLTVHDSTPFNGDRWSLGQTAGYGLPMKVADRIIVHTEGARKALIGRGIPTGKLALVPHGALQMPVSPSRTKARSDSRWTFLLFGEIKPYKGVDVFVEAIALIPESIRKQARFIVAGRPRMELNPLHARIADLHLQQVVELRLWRQSDQEMADLFDETDCFVFPYRQIDASGVYFLVKSLSKWMIASSVGVFAEDLRDGVDGTLVPTADPYALASAMSRAIAERLASQARLPGSDWTTIGKATRAVYRQAQLDRGSQ